MQSIDITVITVSLGTHGPDNRSGNTSVQITGTVVMILSQPFIYGTSFNNGTINFTDDHIHVDSVAMGLGYISKMMSQDVQAAGTTMQAELVNAGGWGQHLALLKEESGR